MPSPADETEKTKPEPRSTDASAIWSHISFAPPDPWVEESAYDSSLVGKDGAHVTYLLWMRQVHVELIKSFHATATRLETALAVQHQSQWQLNFDPRSQYLAFHWLRVVRNGETFDQLQRERMRVIQRESQLEHLVIDGNWTLLVVLDNVRPGDIIEAAYSIINRHPIRPTGCETLFAVPPGIITGRYELSVRFDASRSNMAWKASPDAPAQISGKTSDGLLLWKWFGQQTALREPEFNQPSTILDYIWIQISDLTEWKDMIAHVAQAWESTVAATDLDALVGLTRPQHPTPAEVSRAIRYIQDEFRYLSIDLESGGWIPAPPDTVARRRYGDCKDLTWLATVLLRSWGVKVRPILVGTGLRGRVGDLLPMTLLFNHAVLEVEIAGKTRWFDLTLRLQGGDFDHQPIANFAVGLPVDAAAQSLCKQAGAKLPSIYAHRETIHLDTRRSKPSAVEIRVRAEGWNAESLRRARQAQGIDAFSAERLKNIQRRYMKASRTGALEWRDNRELNVCELAETFEINEVVYLDERGERAVFDVTSNLLVQSIPTPEDKPRRTPWDMPHPIDLRQEVVIKAPGMNSGKRRRRRWSQPEFVGTLDEPRYDSNWSKIMRFTSCVSEVSAERIPEFGRELAQFIQATTWRLYLPKDQSCPYDQGEQWGKLPPIDSGLSEYVHIDDPATFPDAKDDPDPKGSAVSHGERHPTRGLERATRSWYLLIPVFVLLSALSRTCSSDNDNQYSPPTSRSEAPSTFRLNDNNDLILLPSPYLQTNLSFAKQHFTVDPSKLGPTHQPQLLASVEPQYPFSLSLAQTSGKVTIEFVVDTSGKVTDAKVIESTDPRFSQNAIDAVSQWEFIPGEKDGVAISQSMRVPFIFQPGGITRGVSPPSPQ